METLYGRFDLQKATERELIDAIDAFVAHMREKHLVVEWALERRKPHSCMETSDPPDYQLSMAFSGRRQVDEAYAYIEGAARVAAELHDAVKSKVTNYEFSMYECVHGRGEGN